MDEYWLMMFVVWLVWLGGGNPPPLGLVGGREFR